MIDPMTRQEKEAAILAYCEEVAKGWNSPRHAGLTTIDRSEGRNVPNYFVRWKGSDGQNEVVFLDAEVIFQHKDSTIELLYLLLGLETRALEEEVRRLKAGIWELSALVPYPNLALKYLNPPTP